ncbi:MAG: hypothetical protein NVS1B2_00250 [Vulcanimicrobiaceae bacterium]
MIALVRTRPTSLFAIVALAVVAIVAGFVVREPIERALFVRAVTTATGLDVRIDRLDRDGATYVLDNVRATSPGASGTLAVARARIRIVDRAIVVDLDGPRVTFDPDRYRESERHRVRDAFASYRDGAAAIAFNVRNGELAIAHGSNPILTFDTIAGTIGASRTSMTYDVRAQFVDATRRYPIVGESRAVDGGTTLQHWTAAALPLAAFDALGVAERTFHARGGELRDIVIDDGDTLRASAHVAGGAFVLGEHTIAGMHGPIVVDGQALGSHKLLGTLDGKPFDVAGEVHDLGAHYRWLRDGSPGLASLATLATQMATEPQVRTVHLEATAPGVCYGQYEMTSDHGPLAVTLLAADPREPTLRFGTALAEDHIVSGGERTSSMGVRTHAIGGVNGDYFDIGRTYQPQGMLVKSGELVRGPTDRVALAISDAKQVTFGEFRFEGRVRTSRGAMRVTEFNDWPSGEVAMITSAYGKVLAARPGMTFVRLAPVGRGTTRYRVVSVERATHDLPIGVGIGVGPHVRTPLPHPGETIDVSYRMTPPLARTVAAIGGGPLLVRRGEAYEDPHAPAPDERDHRWPVIALARTRDERVLLVAVDGRHPERSVGMTRPEFTELLKRFGATDAMALDSGGSVTLVSRAPGDANVSIRNVPSDHSAERWVSDALFMYSDAPAPTIVAPASAPTPVPEARPTP